MINPFPKPTTYPLDEIYIRVSPTCLLSDLKSLYDSYMLTVKTDNFINLQIPLLWCPTSSVKKSIVSGLFPIHSEIDKRLDVSLTKFCFGENENNRWPFWVEEPARISIRLGTQWWVYKFSPGKFYEERNMRE